MTPREHAVEAERHMAKANEVMTALDTSAHVPGHHEQLARHHREMADLHIKLSQVWGKFLS